jgi:pyridoxine 5-phosphate synthase
MVKLGVNIDHVATVRQARRIDEPDPAYAVTLAELGGADGITVHLREDRRHIQDRDLYIIKSVAKTRLNLEMACVSEIIDIAIDVKPEMCTLVPERREEITTEGGLDVKGNFDLVKITVAKLSENNIETSIFIDPDEEQINEAFKAGVNIIELHTGKYANTKGKEREKELERLKKAASFAQSKNMLVSAGHGLNYTNVADIVKISGLYEVNIGHSIISRSIFVGLYEAVRQMKNIINSVKC